MFPHALDERADCLKAVKSLPLAGLDALCDAGHNAWLLRSRTRRGYEQDSRPVTQRGEEKYLPALIDDPSSRSRKRGKGGQPQVGNRPEAWNDSARPGHQAQRTS